MYENFYLEKIFFGLKFKSYFKRKILKIKEFKCVNLFIIGRISLLGWLFLFVIKIIFIFFLLVVIFIDGLLL